MGFSDITKYRLATQNIALADATKSPEEVLSSFGAIQAQDYPASLWAIGLRCKEGTTVKDIENAIIKKKIARTWLMRGTLHFAASRDMHWMLNLFRPRLLHTAIMRDKHLGLSDKVIERTKTLFYNALKKEKILTRKEMYKILDKGGVPSKNNLGYHMLYRAAWDGVICFGPYTDKEQTFVLLDDHIVERNELSEEQANAELALRYFSSHGPATLKDYVWWSGLTVKDARLGIEKNTSKLNEEVILGNTYYMPKRMPKINDAHSVHLLPAFDEYLVSYADRNAMLGDPKMQKAIKRMIQTQKLTVIHSNGIFSPVIVVDGAVVGTWKRKIDKGKLVVAFTPYVKISKDDMRLAKEETERYGRFLGMEVVIKS
ncbi:MAG: winged helix DNA-binding domain-containing protein [Candidatus Micrarchaeales archaeon]